MSTRTSSTSGRKELVRSKVEHVFSHHKDRMGLTIRTIGLARVKATIRLANMVYHMCRLRCLLNRTAPA